VTHLISSVISAPINLVKGALGVGQPSMPAAPPTVVVPPPPDTATASNNAQQQADLLRQRQGRAANVLTGTQGVAPGSTPVGTKVLLGS
jgi:hypothetical protein